MKQLPFHNRTRSIGAQIDRMRKWPEFRVFRKWEAGATWIGPLCGFQQVYKIAVTWDAELLDKPYVVLLDPALRPRDGGTFEDIPHLLFDEEKPDMSGLCLFDPEGSEWSDHDLIADTTIPWAAKWLYFYELWHYDGVWRGGGIGPESVAKARAEAVHSAAKQHAADSQREVTMAS